MSRIEALDAKLTHGRFLIGTERVQLFPDNAQSISGNYAGGGIQFVVPRNVDSEAVVYLGDSLVTPETGIPMQNGGGFSLNLSRIGQLYAIANVEGVDLRFMFI